MRALINGPTNIPAPVFCRAHIHNSENTYALLPLVNAELLAMPGFNFEVQL
jgi:hypothetical protein